MKGVRLSLRARLALFVALPIFIVLAFLSFFNYSRQFKLLDEQARLDAVQLGDMMIHSLNHAMLTKEGEHLISSIEDISQLESVQHIQIIGLSGVVMADSNNSEVEKIFTFEDPECFTCHQTPASERPRVIPLENPTPGWRISAPVNNLPQCHGCHEPSDDHLGVLLMDIALTSRQEQLLGDLRIDLIISVISTLLVSLMSFALIHQLVVRRVELFRKPLAEYADGKFDTRMPYTSSVKDELCDLAETFNQMADKLEKHAEEDRERQELRELAIIEERERIARELHDGFAQVLGYVNTKVMAVRLLVKKHKLIDADQQLENLETAAKGLFVDVREAILGLKMAGRTQSGLIKAMDEYITEFHRLSGIPTSLDSSAVYTLGELSPEHEHHIFRIVQEALNNIRKHANATQAWVRFTRRDGTMVVEIEDNGIGFTGSDEELKAGRGLGLNNMKERAEEVGADFQLHSRIGQGTCVIIAIPLIEMEMSE